MIEKYKKTSALSLIFSIALIYYYALTKWLGKSPQTPTEFGDMFGGLSMFISAIALIYAADGLKMQQTELKATQKELKESADAQKESAKALEKSAEAQNELTKSQKKQNEFTTLHTLWTLERKQEEYWEGKDPTRFNNAIQRNRDHASEYFNQLRTFAKENYPDKKKQ